MDTPGEERWLSALRDRAAGLAFPEWQPRDDDWTSLHTSFDEEGAPLTEVAVYRGHERIHFRRYTGEDLTAFWIRLVNQISE
ncbi:hypothetical protein [Nonomuraea dietziae]|jgi:hypothetical protein|uniref:Uncharacterized protein n=1 Tax=Nonomuraea dietziae TaxID=65515 RepID=A0A7W5VB23_9ACTN|nr:hypothetical protein [Nonomuraea dietziae]MBB3732809.1 hypothetical protein [Nonomuraea dietziae]